MTYADLTELADHHEKEAGLLSLFNRRGADEQKRKNKVLYHQVTAEKLREFADAILVAFPDIKALNDRHPLLTLNQPAADPLKENT